MLLRATCTTSQPLPEPLLACDPNWPQCCPIERAFASSPLLLRPIYVPRPTIECRLTALLSSAHHHCRRHHHQQQQYLYY